jgi:hypothetical protein
LGCEVAGSEFPDIANALCGSRSPAVRTRREQSSTMDSDSFPEGKAPSLFQTFSEHLLHHGRQNPLKNEPNRLAGILKIQGNLQFLAITADQF